MISLTVPFIYRAYFNAPLLDQVLLRNEVRIEAPLIDITEAPPAFGIPVANSASPDIVRLYQDRLWRIVDRFTPAPADPDAAVVWDDPNLRVFPAATSLIDAGDCVDEYPTLSGYLETESPDFQLPARTNVGDVQESVVNTPILFVKRSDNEVEVLTPCVEPFYRVHPEANGSVEVSICTDPTALPALGEVRVRASEPDQAREAANRMLCPWIKNPPRTVTFMAVDWPGEIILFRTPAPGPKDKPLVLQSRPGNLDFRA